MLIRDLNERSRAIFRDVVETYLETGDPVGSRTISKISEIGLSPASIRNVMAELEEAGLLAAPHTSAGRVPTHLGLRLFVDGLLEVGDLSPDERSAIEARCKAEGKPFEEVLSEAVGALSGLSHCACVVMVPKRQSAIKHVEFIALSPGRGLAVMVSEDGSVENRLMSLPVGMTLSALTTASNYLNARLQGETLETGMQKIRSELSAQADQLDALTRQLVADGVGVLSSGPEGGDSLIVRGRSNLLNDPNTIRDLERTRQLFEDLETKRDLIHLMDEARAGEGVRIFIGSENKLFSLSGSSVIAAPYKDEAGKVIGALGVIGPTRLNYARIVPMVDYTARVISQTL